MSGYYNPNQERQHHHPEPRQLWRRRNHADHPRRSDCTRNRDLGSAHRCASAADLGKYEVLRGVLYTLALPFI